MPWETPFKNWTPARPPTTADFNRIEGNIAFLHDEYLIAGPETARPEPGHPGRLFIATGLAQRIWRDTGSTWELAAGVPRGVIQMWSGAIDDIPLGWALCAGGTVTAADGTEMPVPDLRDRFVVGAGYSYSVGDTGGAAQVTLTVEQLPPHSHQGTTSEAGAHTHTYSGSTGHMIAGLGGGAALSYPATARQTSESGLHSHTFTTQATGGGQPHENRPPYYALAYIMKL